MTDATGYDAVNWEQIPHVAKVICAYGNGAYAVAKADVQARYPGIPVKMIDVNGSDPGGCGILDIERFDATPDMFPHWARQRLQLHPATICRAYMNLSTWPQVREYVQELSEAERDRVRYWVADWTGQAHIPEGAAACQYAHTPEFDVSLIDLAAFGAS